MIVYTRVIGAIILYLHTLQCDLLPIHSSGKQKNIDLWGGGGGGGGGGVGVLGWGWGRAYTEDYTCKYFVV